MPETDLNTSPSLESLVGEVADEFLRRQEQGEQPRIEEYTARYPEAAELLGISDKQTDTMKGSPSPKK